MTSYSVTVTLGRSVGDVPMSGSAWGHVQRHVAETVARVSSEFGAIVESAVGQGSWIDVDTGGTICEDNVRVVAYGMSLAQAAVVHERLVELAEQWCVDFEQAAVAVTLGADTLVMRGGY